MEADLNNIRPWVEHIQAAERAELDRRAAEIAAEQARLRAGGED